MSKTEKHDRQAKLDGIRSAQKNQERRRTMMVVGACALLALGIIGAGAWQPLNNWMDRRELSGLSLADLGEAASVCQDPKTEPAMGTQDHVEPGTPLDIQHAPPAFGQHYNVWETMERKFYSTGDRPPLGNLIHNQEHGFTMLWYDETAAGDSDMMSDIRGIAAKFEGTDNQRLKFMAVPWLPEDGDPFPDGQHIALTHWSNGGVGLDADSGKAMGVWQYCSAPSGEAVQEFMDEYPYMDSPEPGAV